MSGTGVKQSPAITTQEILKPGHKSDSTPEERDFAAVADLQAQALRLLWKNRPSLLRTVMDGLFSSTLQKSSQPSAKSARGTASGAGVRP